jgi:hypothetical protein
MVIVDRGTDRTRTGSTGWFPGFLDQVQKPGPALHSRQLINGGRPRTRMDVTSEYIEFGVPVSVQPPGPSTVQRAAGGR